MTRTNDLASIALTNSVLHNLATPLIYSRFDIVWPDANRQTEARTGVDALTYGLATLAMRQDVFARSPESDGGLQHTSCQTHTCKACGHSNLIEPGSLHSDPSPRKGNYYSEFVKKLSIGNGPSDMVNDYVITTESGKLLGTNVALALARMPNLESFVWDMPTGIVRDVWASLSSLGEFRPCKLEKVWVRFHDNRRACEDAGPVRSPHTSLAPANSSTGPITEGSVSMAIEPVSSSLTEMEALIPRFAYTTYHVETPSFSTLPPLRSISAIDIDEVANLADLSILVSKSANNLRDLRVGMAPNLRSSKLSPNSRALQYLLGRSGGDGTLNLLFSSLPHCKPVGKWTFNGQSGWSYEPLNEQGAFVTKGHPQTFSVSDITTYCARYPSQHSSTTSRPSVPSQGLMLDFEIQDMTSVINKLSIDPVLQPSRAPQADEQINNVDSNDMPGEVQADPQPTSQGDANSNGVPPPHKIRPVASATEAVNRLKLDSLELERHLLQPRMLTTAIDWTVLTSLTLLKCVDTSILWQSFTRDFAPSKQSSLPISPTSPSQSTTDVSGKDADTPRLRRTTTSWRSMSSQDVYYLNLKHLHTDTVSPQLITFLTRTLAPNSLEWLFLQDCAQYKSTVSVSQIYKGPLRRHRGSLTKILIDSSFGTKPSTRITSARKWLLGRDTLSSLLAQNKGFKLRELCISLNYKDWHWLLQQLPKMQGLRSLYVPTIADHVWGSHFSVRDIAMGVLNVIDLRRECELSYLAIMNKCYEIVEATGKPKRYRRGSSGHQYYDDSDADSSSEEATPHASDSEDMTDDEGNGGTTGANGHAAMESSVGVDGEHETSSDEDTNDRVMKQLPKLKMREILFYDEKVSIFKARHAKL